MTSPSDVSVILVHGLTGTPWEVERIASALNVAGFPTSMPTLPGHGSTPKQLSLARFTDWHAAVAEAVRSVSTPHVVLVGESLGGLLAIDAAARNGAERVVGVVTLGVALVLQPGSQRPLRIARALGRAMPNLFVRKKNGSDIEDSRSRFGNPSYPVQSVRAASQLLVAQDVARAALPDLRVPLLVMHGAKDHTAALEGSLEVLSRCASTDVRFVLLPNSAHVLGVDLDHREVSAQVCAFAAMLAKRTLSTRHG